MDKSCLLTLLLNLIIAAVVNGDSTIKWVRTAQNTKDRLTPQPDLKFNDGGYQSHESDTSITIDRSKTYQTIQGFGGAFTDSASYVISNLYSSLQAKILNMYFSEDGLRYNMARLPMGSCDFSLKNYNYDSVAGDKDLDHFSIEHDKDRIIPFIQIAMMILKNWTNTSLDIVASPWSPPGWMKTNELYYCPSACDNCSLKTEYQQTWAKYFTKFLSAYKSEGINIWGVTVQNEPEYCPGNYECMHFTAETERDYIKNYLGPELSKSHPDVKLLMYDHNKDHVVTWTKTVYGDSEAAQYVWGTAVHWYSGDQFDHLNTSHFLYPDKPILATEATESREENPQSPSWHAGEHYGHDIIGDLNNWAIGFIDWNLLLDINGGPNHKGPDNCEGTVKCGYDSMILADVKNHVIYPQVFYYYMGHFSKFVPRGSLRISNEVTGSGLECTAFVTPDKQIVVVVMNTGDESVQFKLEDFNGGSRSVSVVALPHSIQTFMYQ